MPTETTVPPTPAGGFSGVNVTVSAELRTWVSVKVDGAEVFAGILPPGESRDFVGLTVVEVVTGNGRGTRVIFNGVDQGLMGELGEVVIRLWNEGGMLFPTPTAAPMVPNTPSTFNISKQTGVVSVFTTDRQHKIVNKFH